MTMSECSDSLIAVSVFRSSLGADCVYQLTPTLQCIMTDHFYVLV